jgi:hypothetical protein
MLNAFVARFLSPVYFLLLAVVHTWPMATSPGTLTRNDNGDAVLNEWILAWVAHALRTDPLSLFHPPIFYPDRYALAFSENLLVPALLGLPLQWAGWSPVLVHNLLFMAGFALSGFTTSVVVTRWTGDRWAGLLAGTALAFNAHTLTRLAHIQAQYFAFFPLALFALDQLVREPRLRHAQQLALWFVLQAYSSIYFLTFTTLGLVAATLARPDALRRLRSWGPYAVLAGTVALLCCLPMLWPYQKASELQQTTRTLTEVARFSAVPQAWLSTGGRLHYDTWSKPFFWRDALFPGVTVLLLGLVAMAGAPVRRDPRVRMVSAVAITGVALSFGPALPGYSALYHAFPLMGAIRGAARFGQLGLAGLALLAGFGLASLRQQITHPMRRRVVSAAALLIVSAEALRAPLGLTRFDGIDRVYDTLAAPEVTGVVELPHPSILYIHVNAEYMLNATRHWKPLVNGYSGLTPRSYRTTNATLSQFPDQASLDMLRSLGVSHVVLHTDRLTPSTREAIAGRPDLRTYAESGAIRIVTVP